MKVESCRMGALLISSSFGSLPYLYFVDSVPCYPRDISKYESFDFSCSSVSDAAASPEGSTQLVKVATDFGSPITECPIVPTTSNSPISLLVQYHDIYSAVMAATNIPPTQCSPMVTTQSQSGELLRSFIYHNIVSS